MAMVVGPLTDATGLPFGRPNLDCAVIGYREEEYLLEGTATKYRPKDGTELGTDGRWDVEPAGTAPYKSRFVVYRPADPEVFNGTVLVSWNNVSAGFDGYTVDSPEVLESGYAYVAVSAQRAGRARDGRTSDGARAGEPGTVWESVHPERRLLIRYLQPGRRCGWGGPGVFADRSLGRVGGSPPGCLRWFSVCQPTRRLYQRGPAARPTLRCLSVVPVFRGRITIGRGRRRIQSGRRPPGEVQPADDPVPDTGRSRRASS